MMQYCVYDPKRRMFLARPAGSNQIWTVDFAKRLNFSSREDALKLSGHLIQRIQIICVQTIESAVRDAVSRYVLTRGPECIADVLCLTAVSCTSAAVILTRDLGISIQAQIGLRYEDILLHTEQPVRRTVRVQWRIAKIPLNPEPDAESGKAEHLLSRTVRVSVPGCLRRTVPSYAVLPLSRKQYLCRFRALEKAGSRPAGSDLLYIDSYALAQQEILAEIHGTSAPIQGIHLEFFPSLRSVTDRSGFALYRKDETLSFTAFAGSLEHAVTFSAYDAPGDWHGGIGGPNRNSISAIREIRRTFAQAARPIPQLSGGTLHLSGPPSAWLFSCEGWKIRLADVSLPGSPLSMHSVWSALQNLSEILEEQGRDLSDLILVEQKIVSQKADRQEASRHMTW